MGELRKDPILGRWVIIATERGQRPDSFRIQKEAEVKEDREKCPFCTGKEAMTPPEIYSLRDPNTKPNQPGWRIRVVPNKYPALGITTLEKKGYGLHDMMTNFGAHEVIIETPDHDKELRDQSIDEISDVIRVLQCRVEDLHKDQRFRYILIFKNKGMNAGASLTHPHHQLIGLPITPKRVREELHGAEFYFKLKERCIYCDLIEQEKSWGERMIYENEAFISFCPYASCFPFEVWILPKTHSIDFHGQKTKDNIKFLAEMLKVMLAKLDKVLDNPEYNYIIHTAPNRFPRSGYWQTIEQDFHWHIELLPRLTRIAGFEWGSGFYINPLSPEVAARYLKEEKA